MQNLDTIAIQSAGATDVGKVRTSNQDAFLVDNDRRLYIVADGMGGHAGGEIASQMCIEILSQQNATPIESGNAALPDPRIYAELVGRVNGASAKIYEKALEEPHLKGMGTTATMVRVADRYAYYAHVGDSRLYLLRCGFIYQITFDHSLVSEQVRAGVLTREDAEVHHLRNVITRSVGYQEEEDVDAGAIALEKGDYLLLCSDGLHGKITDGEISQLIHKKGLAAVNDLIEFAKNRGGEDNITVVIIAAVSQVHATSTADKI